MGNDKKSTPEKFREPLDALLLLSAVQQKFRSLLEGNFYRARIVGCDADLLHPFTHVNELKYPPRERAKKGRLNREQEPMLYAAYSKQAALVEVKAKVGQRLTIAVIEKLNCTEAKVKFAPIGMPGSSPYATPSRNPIEKLVHGYLNSEITKNVNEGEEYKYNSTIAIGDHFLCTPLFEYGSEHLELGLIYPSVKAGVPLDENSYNIAMAPDVFEKHFHIVRVDLWHIKTEKVYERINSAKVDDTGSLCWKI